MLPPQVRFSASHGYRCFFKIAANSMLRQLKGDGDSCRQIDGAAVARGRTKTYLLRHPARLFVKPVAQSMNHCLHDYLAASQKRYAQHHIALDLHLTRFRGVLNRRLGDDFEICGNRLSDRSRHYSNRSGHRGMPAEATLP